MGETPAGDTIRLNIVLPKALEAEFRAAIYREKGMKKGNISEAFAEAVQAWLADHRRATIDPPPTHPRQDGTKQIWSGPERLREAAREGRDAQMAHIRKLSPAERMELAFRLSQHARSMG